MGDRVLVIGAGLAGLAASSALGARGFRVTLLEARDRSGGRAGSFVDAGTGQVLDACQHVSMGCCTNLAHFCRAAGIGHLMRPQARLHFMTPDRRVSVFEPERWPAPFHLARSFLRAHFLWAGEKARIAWALARLRFVSPQDDRPFLDWLRRHRQTERSVRRFWGLVLVSALNEEPERVGLKYARKVFVDAFLGHPRGFVVEIPSVPLGELYGERLRGRLERGGVELRLNAGVRRILVERGRAAGVELRNGARVEGDWVISAVPHDRLPELLPGKVVGRESYFSDPLSLETSPITSVHLWYDRPVLDLPHVVLVDCLGQWVFDRGETAGEHYLQVVVSAARALRSLGHEEIRRRVVEEMSGLFPRAAPGALLRSRVVTEKNATFSAVPGVDRLRPGQVSPVPRLLVAGDWTRTGWPATMEGAVRSGYLAAEAVLRWCGRRERLVRPDL